MATAFKFSDDFLTRRVTPPVPKGRQASVPDELGERIETAPDASSAWSCFATYKNASGVQSQRRITCKRITIEQDGGLSIFGFCHERSGIRTFRVDRFLEVVCAESGEVLDPMAHFDHLRLTGALGLNDKVLPHFARLLVFLAKCDGEYHPLEDAHLERMLGRYVMRHGGDDRTIETVLGRCANLAPCGDDLAQAIHCFVNNAEGRDLARLVLDCAGSMIDADGRHSVEELGWATELSDALKVVAYRN